MADLSKTSPEEFVDALRLLRQGFVSLDAPSRNGETHARSIIDGGADPCKAVDDSDLCYNVLYRANLTSKQLEAIERLYGLAGRKECGTSAEVARQMGISQQTAHAHITKALVKLKGVAQELAD